MMGENPVKDEIENPYVVKSNGVNGSEYQSTENQTNATDYASIVEMEAPNYPPPQVPQTEEERGSVNFSEVILRRPLHNNQNDDRSNTHTLNSNHSHSTSDLLKYRSQHLKYNPKDAKPDKTLILPLDKLRQVSSLASFDGSFREHNNNTPHTPIQQDGFSGIHHGIFNHSFIASNGNIHNNYPKAPSTISGSYLASSEQEKKRMFIDVLGTTASEIYAVLLVTLGISLYVIDYLDLESTEINFLAEGFSLAVLLLALLYLAFLTIDITVYMSRKHKFEKLTENLPPEALEMKSSHEGLHYDKDLHQALALHKLLDHRYCLNKDRHSSNFYLKVGATGFCFGHLIHSILILSYRGIILNYSDGDRTECINVTTYIIEIMYPIYSILLLFFIFKYSNIIINKNITVHRFGFMHCLASSLCFWIWTIIRETAEYIRYQNQKYGDSDNNNTDIEYPGIRTFNSITPYRFTKICDHEELNVLYQNFSPYLYPFSVEYSILVVGILYIVWINIGLCSSASSVEEHEHNDDPRECKNYKPSEAESNVTIHADCHAANKGLFGGFIVLVFSIVSVILFFITYYNERIDMAENGRIINRSTGIVIISLMIVASIYAYSQMIKLDKNKSAHNSMDNFLLLMCLPAYFVHGAFSIIPAIIFGNVLAAIGIVFEIVQILIQTPFIIDGMARSSNTRALRKTKPGRETVTFLIICNVAMWLMQTFEVKSHGLDQYRQEFYSKELWSVVGHMCLPLMMFYRFHASACIGDIWKYAYIPSGH